MTRTRSVLAAVSAAALLTIALSAQPAQPPLGISRTFGELCATCHGATLTGGMAPSLLDDVWSRGTGTDEDIAHAIREGSATAGMPPFKGVLTEQQVRAMVIYIREMRDRARAGDLPLAPPALPAEIATRAHRVRVETVATLEGTPWGIEFLPDGRLLVTEREGRLRIVDRGRVLPPISGLPPVWVRQDGGMMDVALHPQYATTGWVYLAFSEPGTVAGASTTRILRGRIRDGALVDQETLFKAPPALFWADNTHFGARFAFDRQGFLYYSIGDRGHLDTPQDLANPYGKLHRVRDDGRVPEDNPFVGRPGAVGSVWSYGHRNQQGLAFHPVTGALWAAEHGPRGGDEVNVIVKGGNYGWPLVTHGMNYDGTAMTERIEQPGMVSPAVQWTPSIAVCAIAFYTGDRFAQWKHDLFATALAGQALLRLDVEGDRVVEQEVLWRGHGRVRDVVTGPDGFIYVAMNNPGKVIRLVPAM